MKAYCDTDVIVSASVMSHSHHPPAVALLQAVLSGKVSAFVSAHGLAEIYAVLTRTPFAQPISPPSAWQVIEDNVLERFEVVTLTAKEYQQTIHDCALQGWSGSRIYDALHLKAARKANCERIYTFNVRHFQQMAPDLSSRIVSP